MPIITHNQDVKAGIDLQSDRLHIHFTEDPAYVRSESVVVDLMQRSIGLIFQNGYHHIGDLPKNAAGPHIEKLTQARLRGKGEGGREITLHAPVKIISSNGKE